MYKVGTDIPAGEYVIIGSGYFEISRSASGTLEDIVANDNFNNNSIVTVQEGQYLTVKSATFYSIQLNPDVNTSGEGMFKAGLHIAPGEYKIVSTSSTSGYVEVASNSSHQLGAIITNDNFSGEKYITVQDGQYIKLNRAKLVK